jgi:hypothetical protein
MMRTPFSADVAQGFDFVRRIDRAGRVAGGVEHEQARARGDGGAQGGGRELELGLVGGLDDDGLGAGHLHHLRVTQPVGRGDDDFVAFFASGKDDVEAGMFAAAGDDDLGGLVGEAVLAFVFVGDGCAQLRDAGGGGVFGEAGGQRLGGGVFDVLRGVEVRFAGAETDDVQAVGLHLLGLRVNGEGERGCERSCAF